MSSRPKLTWSFTGRRSARCRCSRRFVICIDVERGNNVGRNDRYFDLRSIIESSLHLQEELTQAEVWERQLEQRIIRTKEMLKPPIMKFSEQLENCKAVDEADIEATFGEKNVNADQVVKILRRKALEVHKLGRNELLGFINTVLNIRNHIVDSEIPTEGLKEVVETVAGKILSQLGRPSIDWTGMQEGQLRIVRSSHPQCISIWFHYDIFLRRLVTIEVDEIPAFVASLVDQLIAKEISDNSKDCE